MNRSVAKAPESKRIGELLVGRGFVQQSLWTIWALSPGYGFSAIAFSSLDRAREFSSGLQHVVSRSTLPAAEGFDRLLGPTTLVSVRPATTSLAPSLAMRRQCRPTPCPAPSSSATVSVKNAHVLPLVV